MKNIYCRKIFLLIILFHFGFITVAFASNHNQKPNIIFIMADDIGYGDLGSYGQEKILTPNIDKLATEGMRFTQAYAGSSVCAPSRSSLLTGFHNGHNRIRDNLPHGVFLRPDDFTIAELLKQAGYATGGVGKWGVGIPGTWGLPNQQGFDYWYGQYNQDQAHFYYPDYVWENDKVKLLEKMVIKNEVGELIGNRGGRNMYYTDDLFTDKALTFIKQNKDHPFFLFASYTIPHYSTYPKDSPKHFMVPSDEPYSNKNWPQLAKNYAAMITRLDGYVGKIAKLIKNLGLEENTLIIFTSDNGPYKGVDIPIKFFNSNGPYRGGKRDLYEGGVRIPFIAKWKNAIPKGTVNDKPIAFWDVLPTFAELIGYPEKIKTDGISISPDLKGGKSKDHEYFYWDYGHARKTYIQALRYGEYKGINFSVENTNQFELYDLDKDPGEQNDISKDNPEMVRKIQVLMQKAHEPDKDYPRTGVFKN